MENPLAHGHEDFWFFDLESDGLFDESTEIHVLCLTDLDDNAVICRTADAFRSFLLGRSGLTLVGHNIVDFDFPMIKKHWNIDYHGKLFDTKIMSQLLFYQRPGRHSLENLANIMKLKQRKVEHDDWSTYSPEMLWRCQSDTIITRDVFLNLYKQINDMGIDWESVSIEQDIAWILREVQTTGIPFDAASANDMLMELEDDLEYLTPLVLQALQTHRHRVKKEVMPRRKKDGELSRVGVPRDIDLNEVTPDCPFVTYEIQPLHPKFIVERLTDLGMWKPTERTDTALKKLKGLRGKKKSDVEKLLPYSFKLNEVNLDTLKDPEHQEILLSYVIVKQRLSTLVSWLDAVQEDGRIHGNINGLGSWTHRCSHTNPNLGNIAGGAVRKYKSDAIVDLVHDLGVRMRRFFRAEENRVFVGSDADGIQLRALAHYIDDKEYTKEVVEGDIHTVHQHALGPVCKDRDHSKTFCYAFLLGAGTEKISEILGCSMGQAGNAVKQFLERISGLGVLKKKKIPYDAQQGGFTGIDGRWVACDSEHLMLAGYLQNFEAVTMKYFIRHVLSAIKERGLDAHLIAFVHDEVNFDCAPEDAEEVGKILEEGYGWVTNHLRLKAPVTGGYEIGPDWYDIHN